MKQTHIKVWIAVGFNPAHSGTGNPPRYSSEEYEQWDKDCPECGGKLYISKSGTSKNIGGKIIFKMVLCENHKSARGYGDCLYVEKRTLCPECGSPLEGSSEPPEQFSGSRKGRLSCTSCDFTHEWAE